MKNSWIAIQNLLRPAIPHYIEGICFLPEHKKAAASFDHNSKVASYFHHFSHNMDFGNVKVSRWF